MKTTPHASPPAHSLALLLWFVTLGTGMVLLACYLKLFENVKQASDAIMTAFVCSYFAGGLSLPVLLVLPFGLRWAFTATTLLHRWGRLLLLITGLFSLAVLGGYYFLTNGNRHSSEATLLWFAAPYLPSALLATSLLYGPWLFWPIHKPIDVVHEEQMER